MKKICIYSVMLEELFTKNMEKKENSQVNHFFVKFLTSCYVERLCSKTQKQGEVKSLKFPLITKKGLAQFGNQW